MSTKYRALLAGIERADSVTMDPHKQLYAPLGAGVVLFRNPQSAGAIAHTANYSIRSGSRDLGRYSIEGSRSGVSIFVHAALRVFGRKGFELLIDDGIEKAKEFAEVIKEQDDFELLSDPELNILLYRYVPKELLPLAGAKFCSSTLSRINRLTTKIQAAQRATGKSFVSRTLLRISKYGDSSIVAFRVVLANPLTTIAMLREMLKEQREIGKKLYALN